MACKARRVWGEGAKLGDQSKEGAQFFHIFWLLEVSQGRELIVIGADTAIRDDMSCKLDAVAHFEFLPGYGDVVVRTSL